VICLARQRRCQNAIPITWLLRARPIFFGTLRLCRTHYGVKGPGQSLLGHNGCAILILASKGRADKFEVDPAVPNALRRQRARPITFGAPRLCQTHFGIKRPGQSLLGHPGCAKLILASASQANHFWGTPAVPNSFWRRKATSISYGPL
jgi:hypothetical protein